MADFLNKLAGGINKGVATVGANSKAMMEKSKIKATITNLENERKQLIGLLGQRVYDMHKDTGSVSVDEGITNFINEINKRLELIGEQNEQMARIDAEVSMVTGGTRNMAMQGAVPCGCGHFNPEGAKFCAGCGNAIAAMEQAPQAPEAGDYTPPTE